MLSSTHKTIMRRIHIIYTLRLFTSTTMLAVIVTAIAAFELSQVVNMEHIFFNMPHSINLIAHEQFWFAAFEHTKDTARIASIALFGAVSYLIYITACIIRNYVPQHSQHA